MQQVSSGCRAKQGFVSRLWTTSRSLLGWCQHHVGTIQEVLRVCCYHTPVGVLASGLLVQASSQTFKAGETLARNQKPQAARTHSSTYKSRHAWCPVLNDHPALPAQCLLSHLP